MEGTCAMTIIVAMDGPSGSGKSSTSKAIAKRAGWLYLDTGALYRAATWLAMRETIQHAVSGLIGSLICAWFANRTGNATDLYVPKLLTNLGYGSVYLIANLVGWPVLGLLLGPILGENMQWRKDPARARAYKRASWLWVAMFFTRIAVQYPIYRSGNVNLLGTVNLAMGYPLFLATAYGSWMILKTVPTTKISE